MPVETTHPSYDKFSGKWSKYRIIVEGSDEVKDAGTAFLPMLSGHNTFEESGSKSYPAYKSRANFFEASSRTVEAITGVVFRKEVTVTFPESKKDFIKNASKKNESLNAIAKNVFKNMVEVNRHGALLNWPENAPANTTPFICEYTAESIHNWWTKTIDGKEVLTMVALTEETMRPSAEDRYVLEKVKKIKVLLLGHILEKDEVAEGEPYYIVETWIENKGTETNKEKFILESTMIPNVRGTPLNYIPFWFFGGIEPRKSPIAGIVAINISHYMGSADLENGLHFLGCPTAWVAGFPVDTVLEIGGGTAWVSADPNANAGFLEFTGQGLGALRDSQKDKEAQMAVLGARLLEETKKATEATDTHIIRRAGEESITASLAGDVSEGFTQILVWSAEVMGITAKDPSCELNRDYSSIEISPQMLVAMMGLAQNGRMSGPTFHYNLQRGELMPEGRTFEEEQDLIAQHPPVPVATTENDLDLGEEKDGEEEEEK